MASSTHLSTPDPPTSSADAPPDASRDKSPTTAHDNDPDPPAPLSQSSAGSTHAEDRPPPGSTEAKPADGPTTPAQPTAQQPAPSAAEPLAQGAKDDKDDKDGEQQDEGSTSNTLHGSQQRSGSIRRKTQASSSSENARAAPNGTGATKSASAKRAQTKSSRLSRFFRKLVPCIPPPPPAAAIRDEQEVVTSEALAAKQEKEPSTKVPEKSAEASDSAREAAPSAGPSPEQTDLPPPIAVPEAASEGDVVVPPTPTADAPVQPDTEVTSRAVVAPGSTGVSSVNGTSTPSRRHSVGPGSADGEESDTSYTEEEDIDQGIDQEDAEDEEERLIMNGGTGIPIGPDGVPKPLLPPIAPHHAGRKCLVLDLDETLVHSSFKSIQQADYVVPVEIEYHWHNVYVIKRPGVDNFLKKMGEIYEVVVFTASLSKYADPVLDKLDIHQVVAHRLFRESCYNHRGNYVKDLSQLGRPIGDTIILDNSPASYIFHPNNAVPVSSWFNDPHDTELTDLVPFLADLGTVDDVRGVLDGAR